MRFRPVVSFAIVLVGATLYLWLSCKPIDQPVVPVEPIAEAEPADPTGPVVPGFGLPVRLLGGPDYSGGYPAFEGLDGNGLTDLFVGDSGGERPASGRLLIYRNLGTAGRRSYSKPTRMDETVPSARLPDG